jgi:protein O-mannosyl-transferase
MAKDSAKTAQSTSSATDGIKKFFLTSPRPFIIIVAFLAFAVFSNSLLNDFVYDDEGQVLGNHWIKSSKYIPEIFSRGVWEFKKDATTTNYYRPMMHIIYMLNYHLFGLKPWGFHLMNILFHAGVSVLVLLIGVRLMKEDQPSFSLSLLSPPFIAAVLFATHPIHTEAVTWIAALPELMFAFFCLLSFYLYSKTGTDGAYRYLFSLLFFAVALLSKETAVIFPVVLIVYDVVFKKVHVRSLDHLKRYIPYFLVVGLYLIVRYYVLKGIAPHSQMRLTTVGYLINIFPLFTGYLLKLLLPVNLTAAHAQYPISSLFDVKGILSLSATVVFIVLSFMAYKKNRLIFFGLVLMVVPLLPALYMPGISFHFGDGNRYLLPFSERYLYLPSFGFVMVASLLMAGTMRNRQKELVIALSLLTVLYAAGTIKRNFVWKDNYTLWTDAVKKSPNTPLTHIMVGIAYDRRGMMDDAVKEYQYVLSRNPDNAEAFHNMGIAYAKKGMTDTAVEYYLKALKLRPDFYETYFNLGDAYLKQGMLDKAVEQYQQAIQLRPEFAEAYVNLGIAYGMSGSIEKAMEYFRTAIAFNPDLAQAHVNYGIALGRTGSLDRAIEEYKAALRLQPDSIQANRNLGEAFLQKGLVEEAIRQFEISVRLEPDSPRARFALGDILYKEGSLDKAIPELEAAVRLEPGLAEAQKQLGEALYRKGSFDKAIDHLQRAVLLNPSSVEAQKNLGDVYFEKNLLDQAIDQYRIVLRVHPEFVGAHFNLGVALYRKGLTEIAIEQFKTAVKLQPEFAAAHNALGVAYRKLGQKEKARRHFQDAVKLNPTDQGFLKNLASVQ